MTIVPILLSHETAPAWFACLAIYKIEIDEVVVGRVPAFTSKLEFRLLHQQSRNNGLQMTAGQPCGRVVVHGIQIKLMQDASLENIRRRFASRDRGVMRHNPPAFGGF